MSDFRSAMGQPRVTGRLAPLLLFLTIGIAGCGGGHSSLGGGGGNPITIAFSSDRALDGSNQGDGFTSNIWVIKSDGSGAIPLTKLTAAGVSNSNAVWSPDGKKLAFVAVRAFDGSNAMQTDSSGQPSFTANVWVMNADGSGAMPLTRLTASSVLLTGNPVWSPDSTRVAYASNRALDGSDALNQFGNSNIWVARADGSGAQPLTTLNVQSGGTMRSPAWSPDGGKIIFASDLALSGSGIANPADNIWVINADGSGLQPLTRLTNVSVSAPLWSPDGAKIAFESIRALDGSDARSPGPTLNIWTMRADGSSPVPLTKLTNPSVAGHNPAWSPDSSKIAFISNSALDGSGASNGTENTWVMNADGSSPQPLTRLTVTLQSQNFVSLSPPSWSPDGRVAFNSRAAFDGSNAPNAGFIFNIWVVNSNGSGLGPVTKLTGGATDCFFPQWQP